ncbi:hypothetical protein EAP07_13150 [Salmonella enterica]|nr:hypothetical protein [Salmonella enterica]EDS7006428.1 hypothetical protein [Salmonella enterica subsp. diarizonae]EDW0437120.1 hypothetical protein [Salmonella enterica subsp. enterica serovar Lexington]EHD0028144.1 hypothetical protein [Salmonella enterica subsp. houtenae serovar 50:g,z51:-]HAE6203122.1 hypothetical protein [Salmonella enterica subsp. diarizonae serovar 50:l,v:z35]
MSKSVFVVCALGFEGEMEAVAVFTTYLKAKRYVEQNIVGSWSIEEFTPDEECHETDDISQE